MRKNILVKAALAGFVFGLGGVNAQAGSIFSYEGVPSVCNTQMGQYGRAVNCNPGVVVHQSAQDRLAPIASYASAPYGHLKTVEYKNTPNVNIMRMYSRAPQVGLNDVPTGVTSGCRPETTGYCRKPNMRPNMRPVMANPAPAVVSRPVNVQIFDKPATETPRHTGRIYGSLELVRGIAHIPTSIVDRSPITHIDGVPQKQVRSVTTVNGHYEAGVGSTMRRPAPITVNSVVNTAPVNVTMPAPVVRTQPPAGNVLGYVDAGSYTKVTPGTPDYWEKVSDMTIVDGLPATKIICRRSGKPAKYETVRIKRPVIGVPTPVPTAVKVPVQAYPLCPPAPNMPKLAGAPRWNY